MAEARPPKRERTRRKLLDAGLRVLADRGDAFTASDVVIAADVSNGTFYNYFLDRDDFIQHLARETLGAITEASADETEGTDPAWRFAVASTRVLDAAANDPLWARAVLRLTESRTPPHAAIRQHLHADLAEGQRSGRFAYGDDPVTFDLVTGTIMATIRRLAGDGGRHADRIPDVVARLLQALGVDAEEAQVLAGAANEAEREQAALSSAPS